MTTHPPARIGEEGLGYGAVFRDRVAGRLLVVRSVSLVGDYVAVATLILLAYAGSDSLLAGAAVLAVRAVPTVLVALVLGSWLDRLPRREGMVFFGLLQGVVLLLPAVWPNQANALIASGLIGALSAAYISLGSAIVAESVERPLQLPYYALAGTISGGAQVVGLLGGATLALAVSPRAALLFDVGTFVVGALVLYGLPRLDAPVAALTDGHPAFGEGWRVLWQNPTLRLLSVLVWVSFASGDIPEVAAPAVARVEWVPVVMAASAFGGAAFLLAIGRSTMLEAIPTQVRFAVGYGLAMVAGAIALETGAPDWMLSCVNAAVGVALVWTVGAQVAFARLVPAGRRAQAEVAMVAMNTVAAGGGVLALGVLATATGRPSLAYLGGAALVLAVALPALASDARRADQPET